MSTKTVLRKIIKAALILAACAAWLAHAVFCWGLSGRGNWLSVQDLPALRPLWKFLSDRTYKESVCTYLSLAGFVFFAFYMTVLLPDLMKRFFPIKGKKRKVFRTVIIVLTCIAAYISFFGSVINEKSVPKALVWMYPGRFGLNVAVKYANLYLIPVSLLLIVLTWVLPVVIRFLKKMPQLLPLKAGNVKSVCAFYVLLAATAFFVTGASAALLGAAETFFPHASSVVNSMESGMAKAASGIFLTLILAPFIEETAFRGLIQHHVRRVLPAWFAIVLAAACFGLWHRNLAQFIYTFVWGVIFGVIYNATGKVRHTILMHMLGNLFSILSFSTSNDAVFGKHVVLPTIRSWLMKLPFFPAVLMTLLFAALIIAALETALWIAKGKETRFIRVIRRMKKR